MNARKKILIKLTNNSEYTSSSGELVTLIAIIDLLKLEYDIQYYGLDEIHEKTHKYQALNLIKNKFKNKILKRLISIFIAPINSFYIAKKYKPNLIMCLGGVYYNGLCILLVGKALGIPTLVRTAEDHYRVAKLQDNIIDKLKHKYVILALSHFVLKSCTFTLTVGERSSTYLSRILKRKVYWCPSPVLLKPNHAISDIRSIKILYVGTLNKVKGSIVLNQLIRKALTEHPTWNFSFVGTDMSPQKYVKSLSEEFPNNVKIYPPIENSLLLKIYKDSEFLVFTSQVGIGYGLVTLEAMSQKCEVIAIKPRLDVRKIHKSYTVDEAIKKIALGRSNSITIPFDNNNIHQAHLDTFRKIFAI